MPVDRPMWERITREQLETARDQVAATLAAGLIAQFAGGPPMHALDAFDLMNTIRAQLYGPARLVPLFGEGEADTTK